MSEQSSPWLTQPLEPVEGFEVRRDHPPYAGFGIRTLAYLVDALVLMVATLPIAVAFGGGDPANPSSLATFLTLAVSLTYQGYLPTTAWRGTVGKKLFNLKIETLDGQTINGLTSLRRLSIALALQALVIIMPVKMEPGTPPDTTTLIVMLIVIGVSMADVALVVIRPDKRALHDLIAGTCVRRYPNVDEE